MRTSVLVLGVCIMLASCGSEPGDEPTLDELRGEWRMTWMESGTGIQCEWTDVTLSLRDSTKGPAGFWGDGDGSCEGLIESENLSLVRFTLDSLTVADGRITFVPLASTYRFEGRASRDEMEGTVSANVFFVDAGMQVPTSGRWRAIREVTP
jgi:hypothetical protein